ncbi:hypothetical protein M422DRAFT_54945 [Sphaerobolus stellatus SS14]|uniref:Uncharacterized protein n=1 Tax=Sphaerobolus stellatus (strain SS14) TaxID=990650 RepID=A0A0C9TEF3_SPHS4|nr:hypothetical protein M422DRAFT_54945 [Sphaerobolus stellatus SS14]
MNDKILPSSRFTPKELLWGMKWMDRSLTDTPGETTKTDIDQHFALCDSLRAQGHTEVLKKTEIRKSLFDDKIHPVIYKEGDMVQVYESKLDSSRDREQAFTEMVFP